MIFSQNVEESCTFQKIYGLRKVRIKVPITGAKNRGRGKRDGAMFSLRYRTKHCDPKNATVSCENVKISAI
jgi:hypothetical protein